jgi:hypothetical protein
LAIEDVATAFKVFDQAKAIGAGIDVPLIG